jgi:hypothetical protein
MKTTIALLITTSFACAAFGQTTKSATPTILTIVEKHQEAIDSINRSIKYLGDSVHLQTTLIQAEQKKLTENEQRIELLKGNVTSLDNHLISHQEEIDTMARTLRSVESRVYALEHPKMNAQLSTRQFRIVKAQAITPMPNGVMKDGACITPNTDCLVPSGIDVNGGEVLYQHHPSVHPIPDNWPIVAPPVIGAQRMNIGGNCEVFDGQNWTKIDCGNIGQHHAFESNLDNSNYIGIADVVPPITRSIRVGASYTSTDDPYMKYCLHDSTDPIDIQTDCLVMVDPADGAVTVSIKRPNAAIAAMQAKLTRYEALGSAANQLINQQKQQLIDAHNALVLACSAVLVAKQHEVCGELGY